MKTLILLASFIFLAKNVEAQLVDCSDTKPQLCVGDKIMTIKGGSAKFKRAFPVEIEKIDQDDFFIRFYSAGDRRSDDKFFTVKVSDLAKLEVCSNTKPKLCVGDKIMSIKGGPSKIKTEGPGQIIEIGANKESFVVRFENEQSSPYSGIQISDLVALNKMCSNTRPKLCVGDKIMSNVNGPSKFRNYNFKAPDFCPGEIIAIGANKESFVVKFDINPKLYLGVQISDLILIKKGPDSSSIDFRSMDIENITEVYSALAAVSIKERADFLTAITKYLVQTNSVEVNIFAGMVLAKIIQLSSSQVVKENFEAPATKFMAALAKDNYSSIAQIEPNPQTLDFAIRVIYAAVKLRLTLAQVDTTQNADLIELGRIAATLKLSEKINGLQSFCNLNKDIVLALIQNPRHNALGVVTADIMGWIESK